VKALSCFLPFGTSQLLIFSKKDIVLFQREGMIQQNCNAVLFLVQCLH